MKAISNVVAEPAKADDMFSAENNSEETGIVRRGSLDSVDRISLTSSTTTSSSILSGSSELGTRTLRSLKRGLGKLWRRHRGNASITEYDPSYKVAYLGNVLTGWAKGEFLIFYFIFAGFFFMQLRNFLRIWNAYSR